MPDGPARPRRVMSKWSIMALFWLAQAVFATLFVPLWVGHTGTVDGKNGSALGSLRWEVLDDLWMDAGFWVFITILLGSMMLLQTILIWPVRRPVAAAHRGWPLRFSIAVAGFAGATLALAIAATVVGLLTVFDEELVEWLFQDAWDFFGALFILLLGAWVPMTILLWRFTRRRLQAGQTPESVLARISARLLMGSMVEAAAVIPFDIMVRRKTDCYCAMGTFWALTLCIGVGVFAAGPAIFLIVLSRRRQSWYAGRCASCGYDLRSLLTSGRGIDRCPECGAGWKPDPLRECPLPTPSDQRAENPTP